METKKQVVNVTTQEEWDIVCKELNNGLNFTYNKRIPCIELHKNKYGSLDYYKTNNYQILTFDEWCKSRCIFVTHDWVVVKYGAAL